MQKAKLASILTRCRNIIANDVITACDNDCRHSVKADWCKECWATYRKKFVKEIEKAIKELE